MNTSKKLLSLLMALAMLVTMALPAFAAEGDEDTTPVAAYTIPEDVKDKLVVIHTNDTHGGDVAVEGKTVGTAGVAALKKDFEAAGATVLLVSAGDFSQGAPLINLDNGASAVAFMNAAGYDAAAPGNHEFDYDLDALKANVKAAKFPILAANIVDAKTSKPLFGDHTTFDTPIGKVGVFGLDTPETMTKAHPDHVKGLTFYKEDELVKCAQKQVDALKADKCDFIIALSHLGVDPESEPNRSTDIFAKVTGVDLVIDGHSHTEMSGENAKTAGDALVVSTGEKLNNVGVVIVDSGKKADARLVSAAEWTKVDEAVAAIVNARDTEVKAELDKAFATTEVLLNGERAPGNRTEETNLGDFAADATLWGARKALGEDKVDVAIANGGSIRAAIQVGEITMNDIKTVFPYGNQVVTLEVTGAELLEALEAATCSTPTAIGAFPQVAGMSFTIDATTPYKNGPAYENSTYFSPAKPGARIKDVTVNGKALDLKATYTVATSDFTAAGGDTYSVFAGKSAYDTGVALEDALIDYTKEVLNNVITAEKYGKPAGRITIVPPPAIEVEEIPASGTAYASTQTVTVDGKPVEFQAYALRNEKGDTNYIKLRDVASVLNGTDAQFSVNWNAEDKTISANSGESYESTGTEMQTPFSGDRDYQGGSKTVTVSGRQVDMTAITLTDDNGGDYTYLKLRDLGLALGFTVDYSEGAGISITTK